MSAKTFNLADYATGKSYDETQDDLAQARVSAVASLKDDDFSDFNEEFFPQKFAPEPEHLEDDGFALPIDVTGVDLTRPPGFVGRVADWIDGQCRYPRRRLAVASAITAIGNIGGMSHYDTHDGVTANMLSFCVAASSTGKEAVMQAFTELHIAAGMQGAIQGGIKSEQEIVRNLIENQASFYNIDEIGIFLSKVRNAQQRGGASYLEGVFGTIMNAYSKANSRFLLGGDIKRDLRKAYFGQLSKAQDSGDVEREEYAARMLGMVDNGLERPFLSIIGFTTPSTFEGVMDGETATQGFVGRAIIVAERDINPRPRKSFKKIDMPIMMGGKLGVIYGNEAGRVEHVGPRKDVTTTPEAAEALDAIIEWLIDYAGHMDEKTGEASVAMIRRAYELIAKVSFILAIPDGIRTMDHVRWAFAFIKDEIDFKVQLVFANDNKKARPEDALAARLMNYIDTENGASTAVLASRSKIDKPTIETTMGHLEGRGEVVSRAGKRRRKGEIVVQWFRT